MLQKFRSQFANVSCRWTCETKSTINGRALPSWSERYPNRPEHMILATIPAFKAADEMLQYFRCEREVSYLISMTNLDPPLPPLLSSLLLSLLMSHLPQLAGK